ncbi:major facilitator superfamily domain-containing protein 8 [Ischnura elegans]|uniref:major facilitator superfamily domain-containing protein 8 n=1 Tax=Ischnura elegans TaxID=197161 RepID=UPI001ED88DDC|nr:major facilitator superfamily domain-containing protein 8 [Ischnura elegans]
MEWIRRKLNERKRTAEHSSVENRLETAEERRHRWRSIRIIYFTMFLMSLGFSIILTGVWPYLDKMDPEAGKEFMGYVVAANPFAQMLFSPLVGWWGNRLGSIRLPVMASLGVFTAASAGYSLLEVFPSHRKYWMVATRFLVGMSSANIAVCRSYVSAATMVEERTSAISMVSLAQTLGFVIGPGLQAAVTPLGDRGYKLWEGEGGKKISMNMYTASGWINVFMGIINILLFTPWIFKERRIATAEAMQNTGKDNAKEVYACMKPDYVGAWTLIVAFFVLVFNFVLLETLGTSLVMDQFAWSKAEALYYMGLLMSVGAIVACATFLAIGPLCRRFDERKVLLYGGFFLMVLGRATYIPMGGDPPQIARSRLSIDQSHNVTGAYPAVNTGYEQTTLMPIVDETAYPSIMAKQNDTLDEYLDEEGPLGCPETQTWCLTTPAMTISQLLIGYAFTAVGYPIGVTLIQTLFSKILGPRPQGVWMGFITGSGCLSRVMGPVFVAYIYTSFGTYWTFGITTVMMAVSMLWLHIVRNRLRVPQPPVPPRTIVIEPRQGSSSAVNKGDAGLEVEMQPLRTKVARGENSSRGENGSVHLLHQDNRTEPLLPAGTKAQIVKNKS